MRTELRFVEHTERPGQAAIEVFHDGKFIASVTAADVGGVRVVTRHAAEVLNFSDGVIQVIEVRIRA